MTAEQSAASGARPLSVSPETNPGNFPRVRSFIALVTALFQPIQYLRPYRAFSHFTNVGGSVLTGGMSYQALFAVFAALWVGFGVFGILLRENHDLLHTLITQVNLLVPGLIGDNGAVSVQTLLQNRTLDWTSFVAALALIWVAMNWFTGTRRSIRIIFGLDVKQYRNPVLLKLRDLVLALLFAIAIVVSAALTVFGSALVEWLFNLVGIDEKSWLVVGLAAVVRYVLIFLVDVMVLLSMFRFLAEVKVPRRELILGCTLGALALFAIKMAGTLLLGGASSNPLLASFAVLIGLLIWFNLLCRTLLLTAAWIAVGVDKTLGRPLTPEQIETDLEAAEAKEAAAARSEKNILDIAPRRHLRWRTKR